MELFIQPFLKIQHDSLTLTCVPSMYLVASRNSLYMIIPFGSSPSITGDALCGINNLVTVKSGILFKWKFGRRERRRSGIHVRKRCKVKDNCLNFNSMNKEWHAYDQGLQSWGVGTCPPSPPPQYF